MLSRLYTKFLRSHLQVRLQSKENRQRGPVVVIREVVANHGIRGLWRGTVPAAARLPCNRLYCVHTLDTTLVESADKQACCSEEHQTSVTTDSMDWDICP